MSSVLYAWVVFPLALAVVGAGWGLLVEAASGARITGALIVPLGIAAAIVVAGVLTAFGGTASAATPVVAAGALIGLARWWPRGRIRAGPVIAAIAVVAVYGAPVLASGQATFAGYLRLDDTATFLGIIARVMTHGRSLAGLAPSTYQAVLASYLGAAAYPIGAFMPLGVGHQLVGIDAAFAYQPYLAFCGGMVALVAEALLEPFVASRRLRAGLAFIAGQPALLYGFSLWGGIKELTLAFLILLAAALAAAQWPRRPGSVRGLLPLALVAGALVNSIGAGAVAWLAPMLLGVVGVWAWRSRTRRERLATGVSVVALAGLTLLFALPTLLILKQSIHYARQYAGSNALAAPDRGLGNLVHPLSAFQLGGVWPVGDFRLTPATAPTAALLAIVGLAAVLGAWASIRRRLIAAPLYVLTVAVGCLVVWADRGSPWVIGKALAAGAPAIPITAAIGGAVLLSRRRVVGMLALAAIAGGVLWSNALAYHDVPLAPRAQLAELAHVNGLVAGRGPTLVNEYNLYADRYFLRDGAPVEPAEVRTAPLPTTDGTVLTKTAVADLDSFALQTLLAYRSLVTRTSPVASRPPSVYRLVWQGRYYELWQRPAAPTQRIIGHVPLGDSNALPWCGHAQAYYHPASVRALCSIAPAAVAPCPAVVRLAGIARGRGARLVAYERPAPIVVRADQAARPASWPYFAAQRAVLAPSGGTLVARVAVPAGRAYELWLGGTFGSGFAVSVDGHDLGSVSNQLAFIAQYVPVGRVTLGGGVHTISLRHLTNPLAPGSGSYDGPAGVLLETALYTIALEPLGAPAARLVSLPPSQARQLCARPLDWIELVAGA